MDTRVQNRRGGVRAAGWVMLAVVGAVLGMGSGAARGQTARMVADVNPSYSDSSFPVALTRWERGVVFLASTYRDQPRMLFVSDQSDVPTRLLGGVVAQYSRTGSYAVPVLHGRPLVTRSTSPTSLSLFSVDPRTGALSLVGALPPEASGDLVLDAIEIGGATFMAIQRGVGQVSIVRADGVSAPEVLFSGLAVPWLANVDGTLVASVRANQNTLSRLVALGPDGEWQELIQVSDYAARPTASGSTLFFTPNSGDPNGYALWSWSAVTRLPPAPVAQISATPTSVRAAGRAAIGGGRLVFIASTAEHGTSAWVTDGSQAGTQRLVDGAFQVVVSDGRTAYLVGNVSTSSGRSVMIWRTDGTVEGTRPVQELAGMWAPSGETGAVVTPKWLVLSLQTGSGVQPVLVNLHEDAPPVTLRTSNSVGADALPRFTPVNSRVYLVASDGRHGYEPWVIDLCPADFNNDGIVGVQDVLDYVGAFVGGSVRADTDGSGVVSVGDLLGYLESYFGGCP